MLCRGYIKNCKLINGQIYQKRYQMPNLNELIANVVLAISGKGAEPNVTWSLHTQKCRLVSQQAGNVVLV